MPVELPTLPVTPAAATTTDQQLRERERLIGQAKTLSWVSLGWMTVEGAVAVTAAVAAGSIALLGFGLDSAIEALASIIVIWRFTGQRRVSETAEQRAQQLVAISFFLLAPFIAQDAIRTLITGSQPSSSPCRDRAVDLEHRPDAAPRTCQTTDWIAPWVRRDRR